MSERRRNLLKTTKADCYLTLEKIIKGDKIKVIIANLCLILTAVATKKWYIIYAAMFTALLVTENVFRIVHEIRAMKNNGEEMLEELIIDAINTTANILISISIILLKDIKLIVSIAIIIYTIMAIIVANKEKLQNNQGRVVD